MISRPDSERVRRMTLSVISFTRVGYELSKKINTGFSFDEPYRIKLYVKCEALRRELSERNSDFELLQGLPDDVVDKIYYVDEKINEWAGKEFEKGNALVFIGSTGIAVRAIANLVNNKLTDSPVIVIDEKGQYVISLLSGHVGGANYLCKKLAEAINAVPVITTATDIRDEWAVDVFAKNNKLNIINKNGIKSVTSKLLEEKKIRLLLPCGVCDTKDIVNELIMPDYYNDEYFDVNFQNEKSQAHNLSDYDIVIIDRYEHLNLIIEGLNLKAAFRDDLSFEQPLLLAPKEYVIGIGCKKGKTKEEISCAIKDTIDNLNIGLNQIAHIASIDLKKEEQGIIDFANENKIDYLTFTADELLKLEGDFAESEFVKDKTGVGNVCERAAVCACEHGGELVQKKSIYKGLTISVAKRKWRIIL